MKQFIVIALFIAGLAYAQPVDVPSYAYNVPFPGSKTVPTNLWNLQLDVQSVSGEDFDINIIQHDIRGRVVDNRDFGVQPGGDVFCWSSLTYRTNARVRSLTLTSQQPLQGVLWMWNDTFGQINAVDLGEAAATLTVAHIPEDFYNMTTTFAIAGAGGVPASDLSFSFADPDRTIHPPTRVRSRLPEHGYFAATPEWTLPIGTLGEDSTAVWGSLTASDADYRMRGYQTFTREATRSGAAANQTAAVSLRAQGQTDGWLVLPQQRTDWNNELIFTNTQAEPVTMTLSMLTRVLPLEDGERDALVVVDETLTVAGYEKQILLLGADVFTDVAGEPVWLHFQTETPVVAEGEEPGPQPRVHALHMQSGEDNLAMGSHPFAQAGNHIGTWLGFDPNMAPMLELISTGRETIIPVEPDENGEIPVDAEPEIVRDVSQYQIAFLDAGGQISVVNQSLEAGKVRVLDAELLQETFADILSVEQPRPISIRIDLISGPPLVAKHTTYGLQDIAIVNPYTTTIVPPADDAEPVDE